MCFKLTHDYNKIMQDNLPKEQPVKKELSQAQIAQKTKKAAERHNMLIKLFRNKRQKDADEQFQQKMAQDQNLLNGFRQNKFGAFCLQAGDLQRAQKHLNGAFEIIQKSYKPFTNYYMNIGNFWAQKRNYQKAIQYFDLVINQSPHSKPKQFGQTEKQILFSKHLNSFNAYVDAHTNIAVMYVQLDQFEKGFHYCKKSLELKPQDSQSAVNFTDILRQLGKKQQAIQHSWNQIKQYAQTHGKPDYQPFEGVRITPWTTQKLVPLSQQQKKISILTVKWGARYNADYVNKLYAGIIRNTTWKIDFYCFTDDDKGLHPDIKIQKLQEGWKRWWGKVSLFDCKIQGRKFYIDLDMIITGNLDQLFSYDGQFATLRTGDLFCQKNHKEGYNSSVMIWKDQCMKPVYLALKDNFEIINKFIVRFDFWLQMTIKNADYVQQLYPGKVIDFLADAKETLPEGSSVVCFARKPKPQDYPAPWVKQYWVI